SFPDPRRNSSPTHPLPQIKRAQNRAALGYPLLLYLRRLPLSPPSGSEVGTPEGPGQFRARAVLVLPVHGSSGQPLPSPVCTNWSATGIPGAKEGARVATPPRPPPLKPGADTGAPRTAQCACQQPREPFLQTAGKGGLPAERRPRWVTAALPSAGGKGPSPEDPPSPCGPGMRRGVPQTAGSRSPPLPTSPGSRRGRSGALRPRHHPQRPLSRPPAQRPPPRGLTLTKAGGAAASFSRRDLWAPRSRGGGGASKTQTRVCSKSRAQRHSTAASHNTLGPPLPRAPLRPPLHSARPASTASFSPPFPRRLAPPLGNPS
ncbi:hypothetical protein DBR06_SOUSAS8610105, partial [Sousa chinensis]